MFQHRLNGVLRPQPLRKLGCKVYQETALSPNPTFPVFHISVRPTSDFAVSVGVLPKPLCLVLCDVLVLCLDHALLDFVWLVRASTA
eukprot:2423820-Amphidinium_carterae.1